MKKLVTEFIGTFFLVFTVGLTVAQGVAMAPLAIGGALMIMVYMGGSISGGHYNPAVSLAVMLRGKLSSTEMLQYWGAQLAGGLVAGYLASAMAGQSAAIAPGGSITTVGAITIEALYTFALALVVLNVAVAERTKGNSFYGLAIGFTVVVAAFAGGGLSGGAFNPAVGTGITVAHALTGGGDYSHLWIYWAGPLLGGGLAAAVFGLQEG